MSQKKPKVLVVGGGIIGAASAFELQSRGADVLVLDAGTARATDASFGWINASFYERPDYFALRLEGIEAYRRLQTRLDLPISWCGGLCWECSGDALDEQFQTLHAQGYPSRIVESGEIRLMEPHLGNVPDRAIHFSAEAALESTEATQHLMQGAKTLGAQVGSGFSVIGFEEQGGRIVGVRTAEGVFEADHVLVAAGTGTAPLLAKLGIALPMLHRPALVVRSQPIQAQISHVLATDFGEVRQLPDGSILSPASIGHQADSSDTLGADPQAMAENTMRRLRKLFPQADLQLASIQLAFRPVPQDGFPAVGSVAPGLYVATLHSGITLAAIMGELIAEEILGGPSDKTDQWLSSFRPQRFA